MKTYGVWYVEWDFERILRKVLPVASAFVIGFAVAKSYYVGG